MASLDLHECIRPERLNLIAASSEPIVARPVQEREWRVTIEVDDFRDSDPGVWLAVAPAETLRSQMEPAEWKTIAAHLGEQPQVSVEIRAHHDYKQSRLALEVALVLMRQHHATFETLDGSLLRITEIEKIAEAPDTTVYQLDAVVRD